MASLTKRQKKLHLRTAKRRAIIMGKKFHPIKKVSMKRRKIMKENYKIIRHLLGEDRYELYNSRY